nr:Hypothetical protein [Raoultella ornithinolytica]
MSQQIRSHQIFTCKKVVWRRYYRKLDILHPILSELITRTSQENDTIVYHNKEKMY